MSPRRRLILFAALAATVAATVWVGQEEDAVAPRKRPAPQAKSSDGPAPAVTLADLSRGKYTAGEGDLFPARSWQPPPPPAAAAPPPSAPPLPFTYIGKMGEGRDAVVFVMKDERTLAVRAGEVIEGTWRVAAVTPRSLEFVYLPMKQKQSLDFGSAQQ